MNRSQTLSVFQKNEISEPALFNPSDTTKNVDNFPEICVSTFSENIIKKFSSLRSAEAIAELYTANGRIPVYKIRYKDTDIAFYLSRVGAPACVAGFEEIVAMGARKFVLFGSCGVLDDERVKDNLILPVSAVRDEGTSYHYIAPSPEIEADPHSVRIAETVLASCGYPYIKGKHGHRMLSIEKHFLSSRSAGRRAALWWKWSAPPCWQLQSTGTFRLSNFCTERIILVLIHGKSEI